MRKSQKPDENFPQYYEVHSQQETVVIYEGHSVRLPQKPIDRMHYHTELEIGICRSGQGLCILQGVPKSVNAGDILIAPPGKLHYSRSIGEVPCVCDFVYIHQRKLLLESGIHLTNIRFAESFSLPGVIPRESGKDRERELYKILRELLETVVKQGQKYEQISAALLSLFLLKASVFYVEEQKMNPETQQNRLAPAMDRISTAYNTELNLDQLAALCYMSKNTFIQHFKKQYHTTPIEYLNRLRVKIAAQLLRHTDYSVQQICGHIGYSVPSELYRNFRMIYGCSPTQYRKKHKSSI